MQISVFVFFSAPDGSSKHVILFKNMEEELVAVDFVWWQLLNTLSAPLLDTSNISVLLTHLQWGSAPCTPAGRVSYLSLHFGKTKLDTIETASLLLCIGRKVCLFSWPCCFRLPLDTSTVCFSQAISPSIKPTHFLNAPAKWSRASFRVKRAWVEGMGVIVRPAPCWNLSLSAALSGILHTTPIPAAVEAWNLTHYTYTCRGTRAAHRAVEFKPGHLHIPLYAQFHLRKTREKNASCSLTAGIHDP